LPLATPASWRGCGRSFGTETDCRSNIFGDATNRVSQKADINRDVKETIKKKTAVRERLVNHNSYLEDRQHITEDEETPRTSNYVSFGSFSFDHPDRI
jgi:hypothetical protein